ncbi:MAG TPA: JAB domain-containing protein [Hanamia sp.]|nr:JAB domain-containing protein [Hanamia sp.]
MEQMIVKEEWNVSEIDIVYKRKGNCKMCERPQIHSSKDAYNIFIKYWNPDKIELLEEFKVLFLNKANRVMQLLSLSQGGISSTVVDPRLVLATALKVAASSIILAHNHPSQNLRPSRQDEELTQKIKCAAKYFDISVADHLIVTPSGYFSFADEGLL